MMRAYVLGKNFRCGWGRPWWGFEVGMVVFADPDDFENPDEDGEVDIFMTMDRKGANSEGSTFGFALPSALTPLGTPENSDPYAVAAFLLGGA